MENELMMIQQLTARVEALEKDVKRLLCAGNIPHGKFAHLGGIERSQSESTEGWPPVDLSSAYGPTGRRLLGR